MAYIGAVTRRQAVQRAGAVIAGAGLGVPLAGRAGATGPRSGLSAGRSVNASPQAWSFVSRPDLHPPVVTWTSHHGPDPDNTGFIFMTPHGSPLPQGTGRQSGVLIMDRNGQVVWYYQPSGVFVSTVAVQAYRGQPVLTYFRGLPKLAGRTLYLSGTYSVRDVSYREIATVAAAGDGWAADEHECVLTPEGTALIVALRLTTADLTPIGGPAKASILDCAVQEIDIATGALVFQWDALTNIPITDSYVPYNKDGATDLYHFNSVALAPDGDVIISSRHTWTAYKVSRQTGAVTWRLGGKRNQFTLGPGAQFSWQHDVKALGPSGLTVFDNASYHTTHARQSRALVLDVDSHTMRATVTRQFTHPSELFVDDQGSVQVLAGGRVLVGWGVTPYISEFSWDGTVLLDGHLPIFGGETHEVVQTYRTLSFPWQGTPPGTPAAAARPGQAGGAVVYASWNGATEVATWHILAGKSAGALSGAATARRTGFETRADVSHPGPYFAVAALDAHGRELGRSATVKLRA